MKPYTVTFGGVPEKYAAWRGASFVVVPYPVGHAAGHAEGVAKGPRAIIDASARMELFDEENKIEPYRKGIFISTEVQVNTNGSKGTLRDAERRIAATVKSGRFPVLLGGEHGGTLGAVSALLKKYDDLTVLQFDAHADLRDKYLGSTLSDACVGRRIVEAGARLIQVGVRSISEEEDRFLRKEERVKTFYASEVRESLADVTKGIVGNLSNNVYITVDLDVFDPGIMPAVAAPEPGGLSWFEVIDILRDVMRTNRNIVGFDLMELSPIRGVVAPDFLAARLCYRMMGWVLAKREEG